MINKFKTTNLPDSAFIYTSEAAWAKDCIKYEPSASIDKQAAYNQYCSYCLSRGLKPDNMAWFCRRLALSGKIRIGVRRVDGYLVGVFYGIESRKGDVVALEQPLKKALKSPQFVPETTLKKPVPPAEPVSGEPEYFELLR